MAVKGEVVAAEMIPEVDLDLDVLAPPDLSFKMRGEIYWIPGDIAVETILEALQLRDMFEETQQKADEKGMTKAMEKLQAIVRNMLDDAGQLEGRYPRLGIEGITHVITLAMNGAPERGDTPERAAARAVEGADPSEGVSGAEDDAEEHPTAAPEAAQPKRASRSRKLSPAPSSG